MSAALVWVIIGTVLCVMEMLLPTAFIESALGISALMVALLSVVVPNTSYQIALWMLLSVFNFWVLKRFVPKRRGRSRQEATEARTVTAIAPGQAGRVIYEGNSWQARCSNEKDAVGPDEEVFVVERKGNTLIVMPLSAFQ